MARTSATGRRTRRCRRRWTPTVTLDAAVGLLRAREGPSRRRPQEPGARALDVHGRRRPQEDGGPAQALGVRPREVPRRRPDIPADARGPSRRSSTALAARNASPGTIVEYRRNATDFLAFLDGRGGVDWRARRATVRPTSPSSPIAGWLRQLGSAGRRRPSARCTATRCATVGSLSIRWPGCVRRAVRRGSAGPVGGRGRGARHRATALGRARDAPGPPRRGDARAALRERDASASWPG